MQAKLAACWTSFMFLYVYVDILVVASLYIPVSAFNAVGESWTYYYAISIGLELAVLVAIVRYAWTRPRTGTATTSRPSDTELRRATI